MAVRVVTDSTSDLSRDLAASLGITIVPLKVLWGDETFRDGIDITEDTFYTRLSGAKVMPTTSQPSPGEFESTFRDLAKSGDDLCVITISSKLSGTYSSAVTAKSAVEGEITVEVVDSLQVSMALGLVVMRAAKAAQAGASLVECVRIANETAAKTEILFLVDTLEFLKRGGRIGQASALLGSLLNIKPMLAVRNGEVVPAERTRTRQKGLERLFEWVTGHPTVGAIGVLASPPLEDPNAVANRLAKQYPSTPLFRGVLGPVVGVHTGPGVVGCAIYTGDQFD
ncbi:MAG: DegV family protein [Dehalococcoidia bacterium]